MADDIGTPCDYAGAINTTTALLNRVGEFVRQQAAPRRRVWTILTFREMNVSAYGKGVGAQHFRGACRSRVGVDAHAAEVAAETRLHKGGVGVSSAPPR